MGISELTPEQQDLWREKATDARTNGPDVLKEYCVALLSAITTIQVRDARIRSLKTEIAPLQTPSE
jgi:hypothetical protein